MSIFNTSQILKSKLCCNYARRKHKTLLTLLNGIHSSRLESRLMIIMCNTMEISNKQIQGQKQTLNCYNPLSSWCFSSQSIVISSVVILLSSLFSMMHADLFNFYANVHLRMVAWLLAFVW